MPNMDNTLNSKMTPAAEIRSVQLNEKTSDNEYQILHPETDAYQVITNSERRFVSEEEKAKWNAAYSLGAESLRYKGLYSGTAKYFNNDVVYLDGGSIAEEAGNTYPEIGDSNNDYHGRRFFVFVSSREEAQPGNAGMNIGTPDYDAFMTGTDQLCWLNINFESYLAEFANNVKVKEATIDALYNFTIAPTAGENYKPLHVTTDEITINPGRKTIIIGSGDGMITLDGANGIVTAGTFVGKLEGVADSALFADEAAKYTVYQRDENGAPTEVDGERVRISSEFIDDAITGINKRIDDITSGDGGAVLSNKLTIKKNGDSLNGEGFDGSIAQQVDITFTPEEITGLLNSSNNKIQDKWLPDTLLGAMSYIGTFDADFGRLVVDLREPAGRPFRKGDYAIAVVRGNLDPSGAAHTPASPEETYYLPGDWAVYNGDLDDDGAVDSEEWTKVDNTDTVRTVNSQIGDVKTYKGIWQPNTQYYTGDIVQYNDAAIYLCIVDNNSAEFSLDNFKIFGRIYKGADGIELTEADSTFRHSFKDSTASEVGTEQEPQELKPNDVIKISVVEMNDKYGHVKSATNKYYKMPTDTWRPVQVNGTEIQDNTTNSGALDLAYDKRDGSIDSSIQDGDPRVKLDVYEKKIVVSHVDAKEGAGEHKSEVLDTPAADGNVIKIGLGSQFTLPEFSWNASGHIDSYSLKVFELPTDTIQHKHFLVASENGISTIRAYTNEELDAAAVKARKFYDVDGANTIIPDSDEGMAFYGRFQSSGFYQLSKGYKNSAGDIVDSTFYRVLDEGMRVYSGLDLTGQAIFGSFNADDNYIQLGDSGVHKLDSAAVYSAVAVNRQGITVAGGQILEFGRGEYITNEDGESVWVSDDPSDSLVIGGLFFRNIGPKRDDNGVTA